MTHEEIKTLAQNIIAAPEFNGCLTIAADSIRDLHVLTTEMLNLGYKCWFTFDTEKDWSMNIAWQKLPSPEEIAEAWMKDIDEIHMSLDGIEQ